MLYPQFQLADQEAIRVMYELFQISGTPLPKDPNLIDYGFKFPDDFEEAQAQAIKKQNSMFEQIKLEKNQNQTEENVEMQE